MVQLSHTLQLELFFFLKYNVKFVLFTCHNVANFNWKFNLNRKMSMPKNEIQS